jgi:hypothetical protein
VTYAAGVRRGLGAQGAALTGSYTNTTDTEATLVVRAGAHGTDGVAGADAAPPESYPEVLPTGWRVIANDGNPRVVIRSPRAAGTTAWTPTQRRVGGPDRFQTAAAFSQTFFPSAPVVYVVGSDAPADAVVAASHGRPVLFVHRDEVPAETLTEIRRLGA